MSHPIRPRPSSQSAVFLLNSRLGLLTAARASPIALVTQASLFPKLRDYFAEFLNMVSLAHLGLLDPSTCVGLRYGPARLDATVAFLGRTAGNFRPGGRPVANPHFQSGASHGCGVTTFTIARGAGIFTCCPSTTPFGLALGPGLPWEDEPGPGNLGFTVGGILTRLFVTHACMVTRTRSTVLHRAASQQSPTLSYQIH